MTQRNRTIAIALAMIPIAALVIWLTTKVARTQEGNYRLLVIGVAIVVVTLLIAIPAGIQRLRR